MHIVIASKSPVKIEAVTRGFVTMFPEVEHTFTSVSVSSGVSNQPMSLEEIRQGALERMKNAQKTEVHADFYVSLEGGVQIIDGDLYNIGWVIIDNGKKRGQAQTVGFALPRAIKELIHAGMELGHATDKILELSDSKLSATGTIGPFTKNAITYADWYTDAVIAALIPFVHEELYK